LSKHQAVEWLRWHRRLTKHGRPKRIVKSDIAVPYSDSAVPKPMIPKHPVLTLLFSET
jgi:hypothetical protein